MKWKPADENSIDFRMTFEFQVMQPTSDDDDDNNEESDEEHLDYYAMPKFILSVNLGNDKYQRWAEMFMEEKEWEDMKNMGVELQERIVECAMDDQKRWRFKRFRNDKKEGNHISVVHSVLESIQDAIGEQDLLMSAKSIRTAWKAREEVERERIKRAREVEKAQRGGPRIGKENHSTLQKPPIT